MREVTATDLATIRTQVTQASERAGLGEDRATLFTLAVDEIVANAIRHGVGGVSVAIFGLIDRVIVEVRDAGRGMPEEAMAPGPPEPERISGRGLWLARQMSDDLEVFTSGVGTMVRLSAFAEGVLWRERPA